MAIDLTDPDEQDWMNENPNPLAYTDITTETERLDQLKLELVPVLAEKLTEQYSRTHKLTEEEYEECAEQLIDKYAYDREYPSLNTVTQTIMIPRDNPDSIIGQFLDSLAQEMIKRAPSREIERIVGM